MSSKGKKEEEILKNINSCEMKLEENKIKCDQILGEIDELTLALNEMDNIKDLYEHNQQSIRVRNSNLGIGTVLNSVSSIIGHGHDLVNGPLAGAASGVLDETRSWIKQEIMRQEVRFEELMQQNKEFMSTIEGLQTNLREL